MQARNIDGLALPSIDGKACAPIVQHPRNHNHRHARGGTDGERRNMQFGVQFFPAVNPAEKGASDYFAESLAIAEEAEQLGFTHARTVEHYFERYGGYSPNPIVFLAAVSQRTKTMRLVTGAVLPVFNHPLKLAGEIAMLDAISGGRLDVGFARAFLPHEFRRFGISPDEFPRPLSGGPRAGRAPADARERHPSRSIPLLRGRHIVAATDPESATQVLHSGHADSWNPSNSLERRATP